MIFVICKKYLFVHSDDQNIFHIYTYIYICIYIYMCVCGPSPQFMAHSSLKSWNFLNAGRGKVVFCYVHEVTWKALKGWGLVARGANIAIRGLELSVPPPQTPPHLQREERDYKWNPLTQGQQFNWSCL